MERNQAYGNTVQTSQTEAGTEHVLYDSLSIDPRDLEILNSTYPALQQLQDLRERILAKYQSVENTPSDSPSLVACILSHPRKFTDEQLSRFIQFIYDERIIKNLPSLRSAIEVFHPRFSSKPQFIQVKPLESNVPSKTLIQIFGFLSDRFAIQGNVKEILQQHFVSNAGTVISEKTIEKYVGPRKDKYPLDSFIKKKLEAIFP